MTGAPDRGAALSAPLPSANPVQAVRRFVSHGVRFDGRASRSEFWWATAALVVTFVLLAVLGVLAGIPFSTEGSAGPGLGLVNFVLVVFLFAAIVPTISLGVRRMHDANLSGKLMLLNLVPYLGTGAVLVMALLPSNPAGSRFDGPGSLLDR